MYPARRSRLLQGGAYQRLIQLGVALGRAWVVVAEHTLDDLEPLALLDQLGGVGMAQLVQRVARLARRVGQTNCRTALRLLVVQGIVAEPGAPVGTEQRSVGRLALALAEVRPQPAQTLGRGSRAKHDHTLAAVLRIADVQRLAARDERHIADSECPHLARPHTCLAQDSQRAMD